MGNGPDDSYWLPYGDDEGGGGGNGGGHRRRRADKPSKFDKAVKKGVQKAPGGTDCMIQAIGLMGLGVYLASLLANGLLRARRWTR